MAEPAVRTSDEEESAHGKLAPVDQKFDGNRFMGLLVVTLAAALVIIYVCSSFNPDTGQMNFSWQGWGLAHDPVEHSGESSTLDLELF